MDRIDAICDALERRAPGLPLAPSTRQALRRLIAAAPPPPAGQVRALARLLRGSRHWERSRQEETR